MEIRELQEQIVEWNKKNFPDTPSTLSLIKIIEELGELASYFLSRIEHRPGGKETMTKQDIEHGVADVLITLYIFCIRENIDLEEAVKRTWAEVSKRTYKVEKGGW